MRSLRRSLEHLKVVATNEKKDKSYMDLYHACKEGNVELVRYFVEVIWKNHSKYFPILMLK